jgi:hypothetical protein
MRRNDEKMLLINRPSEMSHPLDIVVDLFLDNFSVRFISKLMHFSQQLKFRLNILRPTAAMHGAGIEIQVIV